MLSGSRTLFSPQFSYYHHYHHHHHHHHHLPRLQSHLALHLYSSNSCKNHVFSISQSLNRLCTPSSPLIVRPTTICSSFAARRFRFLSTDDSGSNDDKRDPLANCIHPISHPLSGCLSQNDDSQELPPERLSPVAGGIVALGKFDALHVGHRELAIQASNVGVPFLLSFAGMAEVLGWEPRAPIVAKCDRKRVLNSWAPYCGDLTPREFQIDFSKVRSLTPRQFVEKLSVELGVRGVVAGENYRFGYRATGNTSDLVRLCQEYGMDAYIIGSVMDNNQHHGQINSSNSKEQGQVSSTRVRYALSKGHMKYVAKLLGRHHRLVLNVNHQAVTISGSRISAPKSCLLNLPPVEGSYENCSLVIGEKDVLTCRVTIDITHIHMELDKLATCTLTSQDFQLLGIDFGEQS